MTEEGFPVTSHLFIGQPQNPKIAERTEPIEDPLQAALLIHEGVTVSVPDEQTARSVLKILGAADEVVEHRFNPPA